LFISLEIGVLYFKSRIHTSTLWVEKAPDSKTYRNVFRSAFFDKRLTYSLRFFGVRFFLSDGHCAEKRFIVGKQAINNV